jgi:ribosomal protein L40E
MTTNQNTTPVYCSKCGTSNPKSAKRCSACGHGLRPNVFARIFSGLVAILLAIAFITFSISDILTHCPISFAPPDARSILLPIKTATPGPFVLPSAQSVASTSPALPLLQPTTPTALSIPTTSSIPTDTLTLNVTWDQWADIQSAAWFIQGEISTTLELAGDTLSPAIVEEAYTTIDCFEQLKNTVMNQAEAQTKRIPNTELTAILDHQLDRQEELLDLLDVLDQARMDWLVGEAAGILDTQPDPLYEIDDCLHWTEADRHIGEDTCVYGDVTSTYDSDSAFFISFSDDRTSFYAVSFEWVWEDLEGNCVIVYGIIETYEDRPEIVIREPDQLQDCYRQ